MSSLTASLGFDAVYYTYNSMNQVTSVRVTDPLRQYTTWYGHDYNGRVDSVWTWLTEADSGLGVAAPTYPAEPPKPQQADIVYDYTKTGQVQTMEYPQISMLVSYAYNHRKWLDSMVTTLSSSPVFKQVLSYDPIGQITQQRWQHGINPEQTQYYTYDSLQRLTAYGDGTSDTANYTYDAIGNRLSATGSDFSFSNYTYAGTGPNHLSTMHQTVPAQLDMTANYSYNPDGAIRQIAKSITPMFGLPEVTTEKFLFSWRSLLQQYHHLHGIAGAEELWSYRYSASGEREQKRLQMSRDEFHILLPQKPWVYYLLGGSKEQLAVYHVQELDIPFCGTTLGYSAYAYPVEYNTFGGSAVRLTTRPDALLANGIKEYIVTDHLGSTRLRVDQNGMLIDASDYEPFGKAITSEPRQGYIGKEKDLENGLGDFGVRKYDAELGRFLSVDPLWEEYRAWTPYNYSGNNPLRFLDPQGTNWFNVDGQWSFFEGKTQIEISHANEDGEITTKTLNGVKEIVLFNGETLSWLRADGSTLSWNAVSGKLTNGQTDPNSQLNLGGAIPEGSYFIDPKDIQKWDDQSLYGKLKSTLGGGTWRGGTSAWGEVRVPILPKKDDRGERTGNYFIHGGDTPGSSGCIDLTSQNQSFFRAFSAHTTLVPLEVHYGPR